MLRRLPRRIGRTQAVLGAMLALLLVAAPLSISPAVADTPPGGANIGRITVGDLTTEHLTDPLGISVSAPRFSWIDQASYNGATQTAYEIRVSSNDSLSGDMWSSGRVESADPFDVAYGGKPLQPRTRYYWSVRVWGAGMDGPSQWSDRAWFETAFLDPSQFGGQWIARATTTPAAQVPEVLLRKEFSLPNLAIASARVYVAGLGIYKLYVNGTRVGADQLNLTRTDYAKRVLYNTYDVTDLLSRNGANALGVSLGHGYYTGYPVLRLELDVTYANGTSTQVVSDGTWQTADGPTTANSVLNGETYDARLEQPGWNAPGFDASAWDSAVAMSGPAGALEAQEFPPIEVTGVLPAPVATQISAGATIYDFRATRAGWATVSLNGPSGATVTIKYGEKLNANKTVNNNNTEQLYHYTLRGGGEETFTPGYSYDGYRYVEIDAPTGVTVDSVVGKTANTDVASTGDFTSSSDLLNRYHQAMRTSILSNLDSVPTDTPMYEKNGWTGDSHLYADSAMANFGGQTFWENWMLDHRDVQAANGQLPVTIPIGTPANEPVWTYSYIRDNWDLYTYDGDIQTLQQNYDGMKLWLQYYENLIAGTGYIYTGNTFGDEEAAGGGPNNPAPAQFPSPGDNKALGTAFIYEAAVQLGQIARALGKTADADAFAAFAAQVDSAYNAALYDPATSAYYTYPGKYRQTDNLPALMFGMEPAGAKQATCASLYNDVHVTWQDHLSTGAVTTKDFLPVLTQCGYPEEAYLAAVNPTYPGWGWWFQTVNGHNTGAETYITDTMWEAWCWSRSTGGCLNDPARSHNHAFRGTIDDWLYQYVAGIQPAAPGYRQIQIKPYPVGDLTSASAYVTSPYGKVSSSWTRHGTAFTLQVHVPVGATATIEVPVAKGASVSQDGGAIPSGTSDGYAAFTAGSGSYTFSTQTS
jgi:alpha-L-rhamnosidase